MGCLQGDERSARFCPAVRRVLSAKVNLSSRTPLMLPALRLTPSGPREWGVGTVIVHTQQLLLQLFLVLNAGFLIQNDLSLENRCRLGMGLNGCR